MLQDPIIVPTQGDYLKRAAMARLEAQQAHSKDLREGFLKLAAEWERIAKAVDHVSR